GFFAHHPARAELRIDRCREVLAERAVVVAAHGRGEEEPVVAAHLLLQVEPDRLVLDQVFAGCRNGRTADRRDRRRRELLPDRRDTLLTLGVVLRTRGRRRRPP